MQKVSSYFKIQCRWYDVVVLLGVPVVHNAVLKSVDLEGFWESVASIPAWVFLLFVYIPFMMKRQKANPDSNTDA